MRPEGHDPPLHVAEAVKVCDPPVANAAEVGLTETEASVGTMGGALMVTVAVASWLTPFSVPLTKSDAVPAAEPAVKVVHELVVELRLPRALVSDQA